jgi:negative regulator of flagellin synthesis FlgM
MNVNDGLHGLPEALEISPAAPVSATQLQQQASFSTSLNNSIQDRTEVSTAASMAHRAMSITDVRMDKVVAVQQALANGTYQVSAHDVADRLVRQMMGEE